MKRLLLIITILLVCLIPYGCTAYTGTILPGTTQPIETVPKALPFEVDLPAEYAAQYKSDDEISIVLNQQIIGGIILTNLSPSCVTEAKSEELTNFLNSLASLPVRQQYFLMLGNNCAYISIKRENTETGEIQEQSHRIFIKGEICFDIWVDNSFLNIDQKNQLFDHVTHS
ncbi:MAG: hypothetical protein IKA16_02125 [Oscillospiraceae bacterium]|nr:hypothetical protein [Oscillospiraceae bacterium]